MISPNNAETFSISLFPLRTKFLVILFFIYAARILDNDKRTKLMIIAKMIEIIFETKGFWYILTKKSRNVSLTVVAAVHKAFMYPKFYDIKIHYNYSQICKKCKFPKWAKVGKYWKHMPKHYKFFIDAFLLVWKSYANAYHSLNPRYPYRRRSPFGVFQGR